MVSYLEYWVVVWSQVLLVVNVDRGPLVIIELVSEDFAIEERTQEYALLHQILEVFQKQERWHEVVLVLHDVVNDGDYCTNLVVSEGAIDGRPVEELVSVVWILNFVLVEHGEVALEVLLVLFIKKFLHGPTIEWQDGDHVGSIQLKEGLVKDSRLWLRVN